MASQRKTDPADSRCYFRSDRMMENGGQWFFLTREGTVKGPFTCQADAQKYLDTYIKMATHDMLPEGAHLSLAD